MRYLWVDEGSEADYEKGRPEQINGYFFPYNTVKKAQLQVVAQRGYACGVYMAGNWDEFRGKTGAQIAEIVNSVVRSLTWDKAQGHPKVQFDLEMKDAELIATCLERWRQLQPKRDTSWTMEGHQGGWMVSVQGFVPRVLATRIRFVPQCYDAPMQHNWCTLEMARDLIRAGIPDTMISPFYDAARLPQWWQGFAFTQGRLP